MRKRFLTGYAAAAALFAGCLVAQPRTAEARDFYAGRNITIVVGGGAGASLGVYCYLIAQHWPRHIPGKPDVICQFQPGAGGTKAASYMANAAPKDGTYVGEVLAPSVLAPVLRDVKFDAKKFQWLGSITPRAAVITVWHTAPALTVDQAKTTEVVMGSTGKGSESYLIPKFMNAVLGTRFKIIEGYKAALMNDAMPRGELHGRQNYWSGWVTVKEDWIREKKIVQLVQYGPPIPELPDTPQLKSLMPDAEHRRMVEFFEVATNLGMGFYAPPGVPADRLAILRESFMATMRDPAFLADAKSRRADVDPISGDKVQEIVEKGLDVPESLLEKLRGYLDFKKKG